MSANPPDDLDAETDTDADADPDSVSDDARKALLDENPYVQAVGIGYAETDDGQRTDTLALIVFVTADYAPDSEGFDAAHRVPETIEGAPTDVQVSGEITETGTYASEGSPTRRHRHRPCLGGHSIGHPDTTAGSSSPLLVDEAGDHVILTNRHVVTEDDQHDSVGEAVLQPGPADGGTDPDDRIGEVKDLSDWSSEPHDSDSATVHIDDPADVSTRGVGYGEIVGVETSTFDDRYVQNGRTTGLTSSRLNARDVSATVGGKDYEGLEAFKNVSDGGDSGSLYVRLDDDGDAYITALHFAGGDDRSLGVPIDAVEGEHGALSIADGDGDTPPADGSPEYSETTPLANETDESGRLPVLTANAGGRAGVASLTLRPDETGAETLDYDTVSTGPYGTTQSALGTGSLDGDVTVQLRTDDSSDRAETTINNE